MNALVRWDPFKEMSDLERRLASVFDLAPFRGKSSTPNEENMSVADWSPAVDISEDDKEYLITAELPGVPKEAVKVSLEGNTLTISGERSAEKEARNHKFHRVERYQGRFVRSFTLPQGAEDGKVSAEYKDGVLRIHLPKTAKARPKQITVNIG